jgi:hypothetical protein
MGKRKYTYKHVLMLIFWKHFECIDVICILFLLFVVLIV